MKVLFYILSVSAVCLCGCTAITPGEARIAETRVMGLDLSVPYPMSGGIYNFVSVRLGWVEVKYAHTKDVNFKSNSEHKDINLIAGKGSVTRQFEIGK